MNEDEARHLITQAVNAVTKQDVPVEALTASTTTRDLGITSLMLFEFVSTLEDLGGILFEDTHVDSSNFTSVSALVSLLGGYGSNGKTAQVDANPPAPPNSATGPAA